MYLYKVALNGIRKADCKHTKAVARSVKDSQNMLFVDTYI